MSKFKLSILSFCLLFSPLWLADTAIAKVHLKFQTAYHGEHIFNTTIAKPWAQSLEKVSNNRLSATFYADTMFVSSREVPNAVTNGILDIGTTGLAYNPELFPIASNSALSFLTTDAIQTTKFLQALYNESSDFKKELDKIGKVISLWGSDKFAFYSTIGPIRSPKDIEGKRVLVWHAKHAEQLASWGAEPMLIIPVNTHEALEQDVADVFYGPLTAGISYGITEIAKDVTPMPTASLFLVTWMNWNTWNKLSPSEQEIILDTTKDWSTNTGIMLAENANTSIEEMKKSNCSLHNLSDQEFYNFKEIDKNTNLRLIRSSFTQHGIRKDPQHWINFLIKLADSVK